MNFKYSTLNECARQYPDEEVRRFIMLNAPDYLTEDDFWNLATGRGYIRPKDYTLEQLATWEYRDEVDDFCRRYMQTLSLLEAQK